MVKCEECKIDFYIRNSKYRYILKNPRRLFCSNECRYKHPMSDEHKMKIGKKSKSWHKENPEKVAKKGEKIRESLMLRKKKFGFINSPETRKKMSKPKSEEHKKNLSLAKEKLFKDENYKRSYLLKNRGIFQKGHKINVGRKCSEEKKEKLRNNAKINPNFGMLGKKQSNYQKQRMHEIHKNKIVLEETRRKISLNSRDFQSEETRRKISIGMKGKNTWRKYQIIPFKDSKPELKIQDFIRQLSIDFLTHQYMNIEHGYQCDIQINPQPNFMTERITIIEIDGDAFHFNPKFYNKDSKIFKKGMTAKERWELDACRSEELRAAGFNVIRLWESDIKKMSLEDFKNILNQNLNKIKEIK